MSDYGSTELILHFAERSDLIAATLIRVNNQGPATS